MRWGKASKGSPPKRRSVLTVFPWSARVLTQWAEQFRGLFDQAAPGGGALWPSERSPRVSQEKISARFAEYRDALGLPDSVSLHSLRHSLRHAPDRGRLRPPVRAAAGGPLLCLDHRAVHSVSSDFRNRTLRAALDRSIQAALGGNAGREGWSVMARRKLDFHWNLRRLMAAHEMWKTTELIPLLRERGVELSASQVYRLVTDKPERLSMKVLIALCDILDCTPADLIHPYAETGRPGQDCGRARRGGGGAQARPAARTGPHPG